MKRWLIVVLLLTSLACTRPPRDIAQDLPERVGDQWSRTELTAIPAQLAPDRVRELGLEDAAHATYSGPAQVGVRVFRMRAGASAFELIQQWRQNEGLAAYSGRYFIVADSGTAPEHARAVLTGLQAAVKE
jgi:hypothetical protein